VYINEFTVLVLILDSYQLAVMLKSCYSSLIMLGKREWRLPSHVYQQPTIGWCHLSRLWNLLWQKTWL